MGNKSSPPRPRSARPLSAQRASKTQDWPLPGDYIEARCFDWSQFYGGVVRNVNSDFTFDVLFDDGERLPEVKFEEIRRPSSMKRNNSSQSSQYPPNSRVMCKIAGWNNWFAGTVAQINDDGTFVVNFDDGDVVSTIRLHEIRPEQPLPQDVPTYIKSGSMVECKCQGWHKYYPGIIKSVNLETMECAVMFDDGEFRTDVLVSQIKMARSPSKNAVQFADELIGGVETKFKVGDLVMANPSNEWSKAYPGKVERIMNDLKTYAIVFDDGDRAAGVKEEDMSLILTTKKLSLGPKEEKEGSTFVEGSIVECKVGAWRTFYPGRVEAVNPEKTFRVRFVDGEIKENVLLQEMRSSRLAPSVDNIRRSSSGENNGLTPTSSVASFKTALSSAPFVALQLRDRVKCRLPHWQNSYSGVISRINPNGTFRIDFDDGEQYSSVPIECILGKE